MADLFSVDEPERAPPGRPLADRLRPRNLGEVVGQEHLTGPDGALTRLINSGSLGSMIFWGPPGTGKTTVARLLAGETSLAFEQISAVFSGVADLKKVFEAAKLRRANGRQTLLFVDEIHRFNRAQQDGFLPVMEDGTVVLVGATTENPSFELNAALLSRARVLVFHSLGEESIAKLMARAEETEGRALPLDDEARAMLIRMSDGDGRASLTLAEEVWRAAKPGEIFNAEGLQRIVQRRAPIYDKGQDLSLIHIFSLIIFSGIVAGLPHAISGTLELGRTGALSTGLILAIIVLAIVVIALIVFFERAQRRLLIQYPKRQVGNRMFQGDTSHLPLKLNTSGVIPPIFASSLLLLPATVAGFSQATNLPTWASTILASLGHGQPLYMLFYAAMIVFFAFFYTAIVFNPKDTADQLKKHSGFIPGYRPGERTADYIDYVLTRITVVGAIYLVLVCLLPEFLISATGVPFYLGGTSLLIVVSVTLDTVAQIQGHLIAHQYEGLIKKSKLRGGKKLSLIHI